MKNAPQNDPFYSPSNMAALSESARQMKEGKIVTKTLEELILAENAKDGGNDEEKPNKS